MENIRVYLMTQILTIKNKEYNRITSAHQYGGQDVYSHPQNTQVSGYSTAQVSGYSTFNKEGKGEKMIQAVLQEEIGGKGACITNSQPAMACESPLYSTRKYHTLDSSLSHLTYVGR